MMKMKRAFTLIEILVALVIFSFALIISAGVFSNIIGNQSLVAVNSEVNREALRITRQISDDITSSTEVSPTATKYGVKGFMILNDSNMVVIPADSCLNPVTAGCYYRGLVVFTKGGYKIYRFNAANKTIEYYVGSGELPWGMSVPNALILDPAIYIFKQLNSDKVEVTSPGFRGIDCFGAGVLCKQQSIVSLDITFQTKDYNTKAVKRRASLQLKTAVTARSY